MSLIHNYTMPIQLLAVGSRVQSLSMYMLHNYIELKQNWLHLGVEAGLGQ